MNEKNHISPGARFNRLVVLVEVTRDKYGHKRYLCRCDCGNEIVVVKGQLISGKTGSCGCFQRERARDCHLKHGKSNTCIYYVWKEMVQRCTNQRNKSYQDYGARGITVCDEWRGENGFINFYKWALENEYESGLEIDRINNDGNYGPENCRWVTREIQANNKRNNIWIEHKGIKKTVSQWAHQLDMDDKKIRQRIKKLGWDGERAILTT